MIYFLLILKNIIKTEKVGFKNVAEKIFIYIHPWYFSEANELSLFIVNVEKKNNKIEVSDTSFSFVYKNSFSVYLYSTSSFLSFFITFSATHVPSLQIIFIAPAVAAFRFCLEQRVEAKMETETFNAEIFPSPFSLACCWFYLVTQTQIFFFVCHKSSHTKI